MVKISKTSLAKLNLNNLLDSEVLYILANNDNEILLSTRVEPAASALFYKIKLDSAAVALTHPDKNISNLTLGTNKTLLGKILSIRCLITNTTGASKEFSLTVTLEGGVRKRVYNPIKQTIEAGKSYELVKDIGLAIL